MIFEMRQPATRITPNLGNHNRKIDRTTVQFSSVLWIFSVHRTEPANTTSGRHSHTSGSHSPPATIPYPMTVPRLHRFNPIIAPTTQASIRTHRWRPRRSNDDSDKEVDKLPISQPSATQFQGHLLSSLFCSHTAHFTLATYIDFEDLACVYLSLAPSSVKTSTLTMDSGTTIDAWLR